MAFPTDPAGQLRTEKALLIKADKDIVDGRQRLRNQQHLLEDLHAGGHDSTQAERLVVLLEQTLMEWERHRVLIEERVAYLERQTHPEGFLGR
jgi:hypothetical protein